jgi:hypothetical protein
MTQPTIAGIHLEHVTVGGNLTISGVTIQLPRELPPLWVNVPALPNHFLGRDVLVDDLVQRLLAGRSPALSAERLPGVGKTTLTLQSFTTKNREDTLRLHKALLTLRPCS